MPALKVKRCYVPFPLPMLAGKAPGSPIIHTSTEKRSDLQPLALPTAGRNAHKTVIAKA